MILTPEQIRAYLDELFHDRQANRRIDPKKYEAALCSHEELREQVQTNEQRAVIEAARKQANEGVTVANARAVFAAVRALDAAEAGKQEGGKDGE